MNRKFISIGRIERRLLDGDVEFITFQPGVNLLIGPPNTGKTNWLQLIDYILGEPKSFESEFDESFSKNMPLRAWSSSWGQIDWSWNVDGKSQEPRPRSLLTEKKLPQRSFNIFSWISWTFQFFISQRETLFQDKPGQS